MRFEPASDRSLLIVVERAISPEVQSRIWQLAAAIKAPGIENVHPGYGTLLVSFDPRRIRHAEVEALASTALAAPIPAGALREIPVHYGGEYGPDLQDVAAHTGLAPEQVIALHSGAEYLVYFLGFSPGFPYLGGMPEALATPRLASPRTRVPAGSVGIAGTQTGIYPQETPGGWRIIGRTAAVLFDVRRDPPNMLSMGDRVRFVPA